MITKSMTLLNALTEAQAKLGVKVEWNESSGKVRSAQGGSVVLPNGRRIRFARSSRLPVKLLTPLLRLQADVERKDAGVTRAKIDRTRVELPATSHAPRPNYAANHEGLAARMETISPQIAKEWLAVTDKNGDHNRRLNDLRIDTLAREIQEGRWDEKNGQTFSLTSDGSVVDGQHRLWAIVFADRTVRALVVRGVPRESFATIDTGLPRNAAQIIDLAGVGGSSTLVAAVARALWRINHAKTLETGVRPFVRAVVVTPSEILAIVQRNPAITEAVRVAKSTNSKPRIYNDTALAVCYFVFSQIDPEKAREFFLQLPGRGELSIGNLTRKLREFFLNAKVESKDIEMETALAVMFKAFEAFRNGSTVGILSWRTTELFPILRGAERVSIK